MIEDGIRREVVCMKFATDDGTKEKAEEGREDQPVFPFSYTDNPENINRESNLRV